MMIMVMVAMRISGATVGLIFSDRYDEIKHDHNNNDNKSPLPNVIHIIAGPHLGFFGELWSHPSNHRMSQLTIRTIKQLNHFQSIFL